MEGYEEFGGMSCFQKLKMQQTKYLFPHRGETNFFMKLSSLFQPMSPYESFAMWHRQPIVNVTRSCVKQAALILSGYQENY